MDARVLIRPIITEKSMAAANRGRFTFHVVSEAGKFAIKKAVEDQFTVHVVSVRTISVHGKTVRAAKKRQVVKTSSWKKAIVALREGEKIDLFEVGKE